MHGVKFRRRYLFMAIDQHLISCDTCCPLNPLTLQVVSYWESSVAVLIDTSLQKVHIFGFTDDDESEAVGETTCGT